MSLVVQPPVSGPLFHFSQTTSSLHISTLTSASPLTSSTFPHQTCQNLTPLSTPRASTLLLSFIILPWDEQPLSTSSGPVTDAMWRLFMELKGEASAQSSFKPVEFINKTNQEQMFPGLGHFLCFVIKKMAGNLCLGWTF